MTTPKLRAKCPPQLRISVASSSKLYSPVVMRCAVLVLWWDHRRDVLNLQRAFLDGHRWYRIMHVQADTLVQRLISADTQH